VRQYQADLQALAGDGRIDYTYFSLEGYVSAMVAVEGLRLAFGQGGQPRRGMDEAMRQLAGQELQGILVSPGDRQPLRKRPVDLSVVAADGRLVH
jgi:hypothetical protein